MFPVKEKKMKLDIKIKQHEDSDEFYDIKLFTYKEVIETTNYNTISRI